MLNFRQFALFALNEVLGEPYVIHHSGDYNGHFYDFTTDNGRPGSVHLSKTALPNIPVASQTGLWYLAFSVEGSHGITGRGDAFRIFATVINALEDWYSHEPDAIILVFSAARGDDNKESRIKLYRRIARTFSQKHNFKVVEDNKMSMVVFHLFKQRERSMLDYSRHVDDIDFDDEDSGPQFRM